MTKTTTKPKPRSLSAATIKRAKTEALAYIGGIFSFCYHDCSDSMHECDRREARFNGIVDDTITLVAFIEAYCMDEYVAGWKQLWENELREGRNDVEPGACDLPIPYERFKDRL